MSQHTNLHPNNSTSQPEPTDTNERGHPAFRRIIRDARGLFGWAEDAHPPATHVTDPEQDDPSATPQQPRVERSRRIVHRAPAPYVRNTGVTRQPLASSSNFGPGAPRGSSSPGGGWTNASETESGPHQTVRPAVTHAASNLAPPPSFAGSPQMAYAPPNSIIPSRDTNTHGPLRSLRERYIYDQQAQGNVGSNDAPVVDTSSDFALALAQQMEEDRAAMDALLFLGQPSANHDHGNATPGPAIPQEVEPFEACDICGMVPDPPYNLRCSHVFCENCLIDHVVWTVYDGTYPIPCPSCDMEGLLPEDGGSKTDSLTLVLCAYSNTFADALDATFIYDYLDVSENVWVKFRELERDAYARLAQYAE